jgi:hypothetical protein
LRTEPLWELARVFRDDCFTLSVSHFGDLRSWEGTSSDGGAEEVPPIAFKVEEHGDLSVRFHTRRTDEPNARGRQSFVTAGEVFHSEEEADAPAELLPDDRGLARTIRPCEQQTGRGSRRAYDDPTLGATIVGGGGRILDQVEPEHSHEEVDCRVVFTHEEGNELKVRHESLRTRRKPK